MPSEEVESASDKLYADAQIRHLTKQAQNERSGVFAEIRKKIKKKGKK